MDNLDLLKKDWNKSQPGDKQFSAKDIYAMLHKKSSSIVKTLFYISIAELVFWIVLNNLPFFAYDENIDSFSEQAYLVLEIFSYAVILLFIYLLFKTYRAISVTDNVKTLMQNILKTRKIIKYYVIYNLALVFIVTIAQIIHTINNDPSKILFDNVQTTGAGKETMILVFVFFMILLLFILLAVIKLFYKLIYGLLLKRLNANYKALKKIES
ncbi:hypothetical protein FEZ18_10520 [Oceanihabitans sp. IOP_32]|uniref:hypothetical protein n=1 Tax=Oceanihabitans sp. IOP_32 TaxID=2529032 RepID=UPI0012938B1A|nr:hypothetical protein [Oceanihabitans sp. IOP_32]QFZ55202.1 hypothetical protein FEZ18_10520 [Oceanihabitans sp. IOP_32]